MRSNVTPHQRALNLAAEKAEVRAARRAEEDAAWEAGAAEVRARIEQEQAEARAEVARQAAALPDALLNAMREALHADRRNLVNLYVGANRKERIAETDLIIGVIEEEQAVRAGLASSEDILAAFS